ncbi:unnamed protein product [Acanthoscelides obtectus]|uniref:Uncharacterized protein n=1 Tax=Acanthoscelides obtectus TaxID=200917 RepID=A0A9P0LN80_ACAOB|nr:unnamed protein product [Acanthoscelides obtectus]CAK1621463.1 hypothetical protein AOBTE_LOCUS974 [Acanthoscelides obtectus]
MTKNRYECLFAVEKECKSRKTESENSRRLHSGGQCCT